MEISLDNYIINKSLKYNRLSFQVLEISILASTYTRIKIYIYVPYFNSSSYPTKIIDFILLKGGEIKNG